MTEEISVDVPDSEHNIFNRIIRDPGVRWANERRCSEMLCAVLLNAPELRTSIFRWFAEITNQNITCIENIVWTIRTEGYASGKSIDIVIRGRAEEDGDDIVLWIVEVKVGATFHQSGSIAYDDKEKRYEENERWSSLRLTTPIEKLLNNDNQGQELISFTKKAIDNLKEVDIIGVIEKELARRDS